MEAITIRKLPDGAKQRLRLQAATHGRSMEAEAREILLDGLDQGQRIDFSWIEQLIAVGEELGGAELPVMEDQPATYAEFSS